MTNLQTKLPIHLTTYSFIYKNLSKIQKSLANPATWSWGAWDDLSKQGVTSKQHVVNNRRKAMKEYFGKFNITDQKKSRKVWKLFSDKKNSWENNKSG